jgi:hypothetical protein
MPMTGDGNVLPASALELDGDLTINHGFTIRQPAEGEEYISTLLVGRR